MSDTNQPKGRAGFYEVAQSTATELDGAILHTRAVLFCVSDAVLNINQWEDTEARQRSGLHACDLAAAASFLMERAFDASRTLESQLFSAGVEADESASEAAGAMRVMLSECEALGCSPLAAEQLRAWLKRYAAEPISAEGSAA